MRCVITGAAQGIGRALSERFRTEGHDIVGIDLNAQELPFPIISCDLTRPIDINHLIKRLREGPTIDVLVHNAGINHVAAFELSDLDEQRQVLALNLRSPMLLTQSLLDAGALTEGGSLVFIASLSHYVGYPGAAVYAASKDGLTAYAEALAGQGRRVLTVFPGPTCTEHARQHSPDNRREHRRMPPERLADMIYLALRKRKRRLIPGAGNRIFALLGRMFPRLTEWMLCRAILNKLK